ncbi:MAG: T9SS C-terminal target domain-containing protein, partial [Crocinitomicaceae bacterium]|nr:T9SS C-terminal target domain-containing protein [Crocinitomicaceae bacterium]
TIVKEVFESQDYVTKANALRTTINSYVQADPFKFFTYTQFQNSLTTSIAGGGPGGTSIPGIKTLMDARVTFFNSNSNYILVAPTISAYAASNNSPAYGSSIYLTATCSNETNVYLGYRLDHTFKFNRVQMFDDGNHGDGAAGDHVYGAEVTLNGVVLEYYFYAENANAGLFSPQRAEHEYHTLPITIPYVANGDVLINEVLASNGGVAYDSNNESDDWVELYNTKSTGVDLSGLYLSDDPLNLAKWTVPIGTKIPANSYLIIWCDDDIIQTGLHTNFKLSSLGETVTLSDGVTVYDQIAFGVQTQNVSYARCPNGALTWNFAMPTFNATNNCEPVGLEEMNESKVSVFPNPTISTLTIKLEDLTNASLSIVDIQGREVYSLSTIKEVNNIDASDWTFGYYIATITTANGFRITKKIVKN